VKIEESLRNTYPIVVNVIGDPLEGYAIGELTPNPQTIQIGGPESQVSSIDRVVARVDVTGMKETGDLPAELLLFDRDGNPISQTLLINNLDDNGIRVRVQILNKKMVRLEFGIHGEVADGYRITDMTTEPSTIQVSGTDAALANLTQISIPSEAVDVTGAQDKIEKTVDILPYLPEGISLADANANLVVVTVLIDQIGARTIDLPVEAIQILNLSDRLTLSYEYDSSVSIQFTGTQEELDALDINNAVFLDLKDQRTAGTFELPVQIELSSGVSVLRIPNVRVTLTNK